MQFRITTLMLIMGTFAVPLAMTGAAGIYTQIMGVATTSLAWTGVLITSWASNLSPETSVMGHITALTCGIFSAYLGVLGVSLCIGHGLAALFA